MSATRESLPVYEPPRLRPLGSVHELTQAKTLGPGDALLFHPGPGGRGRGRGIVNGS